MHSRLLLGTWIRRFLLEHLITERNLSHNTRQAIAIPWFFSSSSCTLTTRDLWSAFSSMMFRRRSCACFLPTSSQVGPAAWQPATSDLPPFTLWQDSSAFTAPSILLGVLKFAPFHLRRLQNPRSGIWKRRTWMHSCSFSTVGLPWGIGTMRFSCFSTTPERAPTRLHMCM